jgi:hypothetical protein
MSDGKMIYAVGNVTLRLTLILLWSETGDSHLFSPSLRQSAEILQAKKVTVPNF